MLYLKLRAEFGDHPFVDISTIVYNNPLGDVVSAYEIVFDESSHIILGNRCKRGCFYPLGKVINSDKDETVPIRSGRFDFSNHVNTHIAKGHGEVRTFNGTGGIVIPQFLT